MKILVSGGAGYIGSTLVPRLLFLGLTDFTVEKLTVVDNFMYGQAEALAPLCRDPRFKVICEDARDARTMRELVKDHDVVIPLAAIVGAPACKLDPVAATSTNQYAIRMLSNLMSKDQWMLIPITNSGYGNAQGEWCTEDTPMKPVSLYGDTKVAAEKIALERENTISFRLATVFGMSPRMRLDLLVNDFVYRAVKDRFVVLFESHFKRNYIHVRDVSRAFELGLHKFEAMRGKAYNVGLSDANLSKMELCEKIKEHVDFTILEAPVGEDPDKRDYLVSNARIEACGFTAVHSLDMGIKELVKGVGMMRGGAYSNV
jgi:nucleoside-diphosphate-sugar epimerase